jgi:hypothetical protein
VIRSRIHTVAISVLWAFEFWILPTYYRYGINVSCCIPPLWSGGQSFWLQIQRSRVPFPALPDLWEVVRLERGPLSLMRITEELLEWKCSGSGSRKSRLTAVGVRCADHATLSAKVDIKCGCRSVGVVPLRTKVTEFSAVTMFLVYFAYFAKQNKKKTEKKNVLRSPCCLCVCVSPPINLWMSESIFMKLGMYIMATEPISAAYLKNFSRHSVCLYVYRPYSL